MIAIGLLFVRMLCDYFKPRQQLEAEILVLRHQLNVLQQRASRRAHLRWVDRALFIWLYRRCPRILNAITIVRPETVLRWHRMGFAAYWRWKSRSAGGRPRIAKEVRDLIRRMSLENPLWGATKIHGELLKLGIRVVQSTVSIYMVPRRDRPLQTWKTFVRNHMGGIASIDLFVVPTITFQQLFALLVLGHERRRMLWFAVTCNPTAKWLARQITEAFPWDTPPKYLIRDNDRAFGVAFKARLRAMGIRDRPTSFCSPWQNGHVERLIGSIRRECTDHLLVFNAEHLRRRLNRITTRMSTFAAKLLGQVKDSAAAAGVACSVVHAQHEHPYQAIIDTAITRGCDLIVMASHGQREISAIVLGSETVKVLTHSTIPVLVYRGPSYFAAS